MISRIDCHLRTAQTAILLALVHCCCISAQEKRNQPEQIRVANQPSATRRAAPRRTISERERRFRDLAKNVESLERKGAIIRQAAELALPSVVHIEADKRPTAQQSEDYGFHEGVEGYIEEAGSGVLVEIQGRCYVLTNRHVILNAELDGIRVQLANRRIIKPTDSWSDTSTDVAVLEIPCRDVVAARLGNSKRVGIGDFVLAFGSPFGLSHSLSYGIISATGRRDLILGEEKVRLQNFLQTDAAINPGNSGGPLLNLRGEVIGLNTAIASNSGANEGIGFAIPIHMAMVVANHLVKDGEMTSAYLGVELESHYSAEDSENLGLPYGGTKVSSVAMGSPADIADIRSGDVIMRFGDQTIEDDGHLVSLVGFTEIGTSIPVELFRGRELVKTKVRITAKTTSEIIE